MYESLQATLETHFDRFWIEWEARKQKILGELQSNLIEPADIQIQKIEQEMSSMCEENKVKTMSDLAQVEAMQNDLSQSLDTWCQNITDSIEALKKEQADIVHLGQEAAQALQQGREAFEKEQQESISKLHASVMQIIGDASKSIVSINERNPLPPILQ